MIFTNHVTTYWQKKRPTFFQKLMNTNLLRLYILTFAFVVSQDCDTIISLANSLQMNRVNPAIMSQINSDCCLAFGISCVGQDVTAINWNSLKLNGTFNPTIFVNLTSLKSLSVRTNKITGTLPVSLPQSLIFFDIGGNLLNGSVPSVWPNRITQITSYANSFTGRLPSTFPASLKHLNIGDNRLSGIIPTLPQNISILHLDTNLFSGPLPADFPKNIVALRLCRNAGLYGDVTNIIPLNLNFLWLGDQNGNYGTYFTGVLTINRPRELFLDRNNITDIQISDPSLLIGNCDISYNPLLGNPHISNLGSCIQNGLFTPAINTASAKSSMILYSVSEDNVTISNNLESRSAKKVQSESTLQISTTASLQLTSFLTLPTRLMTLIDILLIGIQLLISFTILLWVMWRTPFSREFKRKLTKSNKVDGNGFVS